MALDDLLRPARARGGGWKISDPRVGWAAHIGVLGPLGTDALGKPAVLGGEGASATAFDTGVDAAAAAAAATAAAAAVGAVGALPAGAGADFFAGGADFLAGPDDAAADDLAAAATAAAAAAVGAVGAVSAGAGADFLAVSDEAAADDLGDEPNMEPRFPADFLAGESFSLSDSSSALLANLLRKRPANPPPLFVLVRSDPSVLLCRSHITGHSPEQHAPPSSVKKRK